MESDEEDILAVMVMAEPLLLRDWEGEDEAWKHLDIGN